MGYINNNTGYPSHTLSSRSVIKKNIYAVITPDGLVKNNIYGYENCDISILSSPLLGASFIDYIITVKKDGRNLEGIGNNREEVFLFVIEGSLLVYNDNKKAELTKGGYFFSPASFKCILKIILIIMQKFFYIKENINHLIIYHQKQYMEILMIYHIKVLKKWIMYL